MGAEHDEAVDLYTDRHRSYLRFIGLFRYPQGIRAFFRASPLLRSGLRVLDAGCGTGIVTLALRDALVDRGFEPAGLHAFDLTPAMLDRFRESLGVRGIEDVSLARCDVLALDELPVDWTGYDLIVSAAMMEYLPRDRLADALSGLRARLGEGGRLVLFITRDNFVMKPLIGRWWDSNLYRREELRRAFERAGFATVEHRRFPAAYRHLDFWGHIVEASG
jgi:SAM-dependent methyltransferase